MIHYSRCNLQSTWIAVSAADDFGRVDQVMDACEVFLIDNFSVIFIIQRGRTKLFSDLFLNLTDEFILDFFIAVNIIRCHTGLSTVEIFSKYNSSGGQFEIGTFLYDTWAFSAEFESNRSQVRGCFCHYFTTCMLTSSEEDIVKMLIEQRCVFCTFAIYDCYIMRIKTFANNRFDHAAGVRGICTWFQYNCISGSDGIYQRISREQERIIPWAHDQNHTVRRWFLIASGGELGDRSPYSLFLCVGWGVADHVAEF